MQGLESTFGMIRCVSSSGPKKRLVMFRNPTSNLFSGLLLTDEKALIPGVFSSCMQGQRRGCDA